MSRFKEALEWYSKMHGKEPMPLSVSESIQLALRIADRLESGDVSESMNGEVWGVEGHTLDYYKEVFKAMSAQLIKEESGE